MIYLPILIVVLLLLIKGRFFSYARDRPGLFYLLLFDCYSIAVQLLTYFCLTAHLFLLIFDPTTTTYVVLSSGDSSTVPGDLKFCDMWAFGAAFGHLTVALARLGHQADCLNHYRIRKGALCAALPGAIPPLRDSSYC